MDSLLLDPAHPRMENESLNGKTDWEAAKGPVQRVRPSTLPVLGTTSAAWLSAWCSGCYVFGLIWLRNIYFD